MALTSTPRIAAAARSADADQPNPQRRAGLALAFIGLLLAAVAFVANIGASSILGDGGETSVLPWSFGLTTLGFGTVKIGIGLILIAILTHLYRRVASMKEALPTLVTTDTSTPVAPGDYRSRRGLATVSATRPKQLPIHTMAQRMWPPMLAMGAMLVVIGFFASLAWAGGSGAARAWTQGLQFLGEAMLLAGISFLLGSILAGLRNGGGDVQEALGVDVKTLKMPATAKAFVAFMMSGLTLGVVQFIIYLTLIGADAAEFAQTNVWLGPLREVSLGLLLVGVVLALATIAKALGFQFDRIVELIKTGR